MTPHEQLLEIGKSEGWGWQKKLAPRFGWSERTMRRKVAGDSPIDKTEAEAIRRQWNRLQKKTGE